MSIESRRKFLAASSTLLVGSVALGSVLAHASEEHAHMHGDSGDGQAIDATAKDTCATCQFWGGMRKISEDKKQVIAQSMGWCNNPDSPNHQKLTMADHRMKKPGTWKRWPAL
jgi:anaerobic selenocysteine-containing dehydrogenase